MDNNQDPPTAPDLPSLLSPRSLWLRDRQTQKEKAELQRLIDENMAAIADSVGPGADRESLLALGGVRQGYIFIMSTMFGDKEIQK